MTLGWFITGIVAAGVLFVTWILCVLNRPAR